MRVLLQRVSRASVTVCDRTTGQIGQGLVAYVGIASGDTAQDIEYLAEKTSTIRLFPDEAGRFDRSVAEAGGSVLVVSQFTLYADTRRGRRPGFPDAAAPETAEPMVAEFGHLLRQRGVPVETGEFGAMMQVDSVNDGPVSIIIDSADRGRTQRG